MEQIDKTLQDLRMELHGAKVGGRVALGIALTMGSLLAWVGSLLKDQLAKVLLIGSLVFLSSCAQLTPEQQSELASLRQQVMTAEQGIRSHAQEIEQAKKDFQAGKLTQEQLNALVLRSQEQVDALVSVAKAASAKAVELQKQGVPPWQTFWEAGGRELVLGLAGVWLVKNQKATKQQAIDDALAKVTEIRGPIEARKGLPPRGIT